MSRAAEGGEDTADGSPSRPSKTNPTHEYEQFAGDVTLARGKFPSPQADRPLSVVPDDLREDATVKVSGANDALDWLEVVNKMRIWYAGYQRSHIEFNSPEGETVRSKLKNSYQPSYARVYYARLKQLERAVRREFTDVTTVMLTLSASSENQNGEPRCPGDHMREIRDVLPPVRAALGRALDGSKWEYARVWEPHESGYGHMHIAVFFDGDASAKAFKSVMDSHVRNCPGASSKAHHNKPCSEHAGEGSNPWDSAESGCEDCDTPVSVNDDVENLGSYISEYIGIFGDGLLERPVSEQMFYAACWATGTRRLDFSNGAQDLIRDQKKHDEFFHETGIRSRSTFGKEAFGRWINRNYPEWKSSYGDTPGPQSPIIDDREGASDIESSSGGEEAGEWVAERVCKLRGTEPDYAEPGSGGVDTVKIRGRPGLDPPKVLD